MLRKIGKTKAVSDDEARFAALTGRYRFIERGESVEEYSKQGIAVIRRLVPTSGQLHFKIEFTADLKPDDFRVICTHGIKNTGSSVSMPYVNVLTNYV